MNPPKCAWLFLLCQSYNLSNLTRNTSYTVTVSVMNIEGVGPSSVPAENSTLEEGG